MFHKIADGQKAFPVQFLQVGQMNMPGDEEIRACGQLCPGEFPVLVNEVQELAFRFLRKIAADRGHPARNPVAEIGMDEPTQDKDGKPTANDAPEYAVFPVRRGKTVAMDTEKCFAHEIQRRGMGMDLQSQSFLEIVSQDEVMIPREIMDFDPGPGQFLKFGIDVVIGRADHGTPFKIKIEKIAHDDQGRIIFQYLIHQREECFAAFTFARILNLQAEMNVRDEVKLLHGRENKPRPEPFQ